MVKKAGNEIRELIMKKTLGSKYYGNYYGR